MSCRETTLLDSLNCRHPWHEKRLTSTGLIVDVSDTTKESAETIDTEGLSPAVLASAGSVALALYFYYVRGDKQRGQLSDFGLLPFSRWPHISNSKR
jgi:hypothetical protein